jgi:ABC-type nitrate/sulfonate/bicarbonate transport system substrate-binding protein
MTEEVLLSRRRVLGTGCLAASALTLPSCSPKPLSAGEIDIVMTAGVSGLVVHEVARAEGFFDQFSVAPKVLVVSDGSKCVAALLSGAARICMWSGFNQLTPAIEKGARIKILAGALNLASMALYSGNPAVKTVQDLKGKVIGIGSLGSVLHQMSVLVLRKKGVSPGDVSFRNVGSSADIFKAVAAKAVDAGLSDVDVFDQQGKYGIHALPDGLLWKEIPEYTNQGTYATDTAIQQNRDMLVRVLAAYAKAYRFVSVPESRDAFVKARAKVATGSDTQQALTQWRWIQANQPYAMNLTLSDERINFIQKLNVEFKNQNNVLPIASVADMSLATDALKLIEDKGAGFISRRWFLA